MTMKKKLSNIILAGVLATSISACSKFDEINTDPNAASGSEQVQVEYFLNHSIIQAQMNPDVAERSFVLYWKTAAHQQLANGLTTGSYDSDWTNAYWAQISEWLSHVNTAIQIAEEKAEDGTAQIYNDNLIQVSRIWRAYLMSELSDNFGPIPIVSSQGVNPEFNSTKEVYYFLLDELKDAASKIDEGVARTDKLKDLDPAYAYDWDKWIRYANSMRMRLAMRLSEVDEAKARAEFEDAAKSKLIENFDQSFKVKERPGWDDLSGVMSREWNGQVISATLNNLFIGLGGVKSEDQLADSLHSKIKPADYMGKRYLDHYSTITNDPSAGYFFDGLPYSIDPRAYKTYFIPGDFNNPKWSNYPSYSDDPKTTKTKLRERGGHDEIEVDTKFTWSTFANGDFGGKGTANGMHSTQIGKIPGLAHEYRASDNERIFFADWEVHFLLAEAAVRNWDVNVSAQQAYEDGIKAHFAHLGASEFVNDYLNSEDYNRVGTSVKFTHTTEPGSSFTMQYIDGYTGNTGTVSIDYPENTIYKNGTVKNDELTKIITQKFIANNPWLPLEAWSDHRRLGLPFFENPARENSLTNLPDLKADNYHRNQISFFPQRLKYPSNFRNVDDRGYNQALDHLDGPDEVLTPLWWAQK